jgi:hypothetical protein
MTVCDEANVDATGMRTDQRRRNAGPGGERAGVDNDFVSGGIDGADGEQGTILFRRKAGDDACGKRSAMSGAVRIRSRNLAPGSSTWRHSMQSVVSTPLCF